ncbi:MAG TPA: anti-sigma factor [Chitinophagaceae bacterium]|nr:anti-sigma factor [Chitinophagaceae bacterium]
MNIQEYISSGIVESYVLGLASDDERAEFDRMCAQYPELGEARNNFELALEAQARRNAMRPPEEVKVKIWSAIQQTASKPSKIVRMEPSIRRSTALRWTAAASVILFLVAAYLAFSFYNQNKNLENSNRNLEAKINSMDSMLSKMVDDQKVLRDPNVTVVNMVGTQKGSPSSASVYWDSTSTNVYLIVKNMPRLPSDRQYQLWALIDNKPVDLGLFDPKDNRVILKMKNTQKADAFAITIERRGNTGGPNLNQLQSMGKAKL